MQFTMTATIPLSVRGVPPCASLKSCNLCRMFVCVIQNEMDTNAHTFHLDLIVDVVILIQMMHCLIDWVAVDRDGDCMRLSSVYLLLCSV